MKKTLTRFIKDERGATAIEYGLIAGLVALAVAVGAQSLGTSISTSFTNLGTTITGWLTPKTSP